MSFSQKLYKCIFEDFKGLNLTNINEFESFEILLINDSIVPTKISTSFFNNIFDKKIVLDIGFGGGFPILPLANEYKDIKFIGIDSKRKKVDAVNDIKNKLNLKNVFLYHERIENLLIDIELVVVVKAVGDIKDVLNKIFTTKKLFIYFYKGPNLDTKENYTCCLNDWNKIEEIKYNIGTNQRSLIGFSNINVPHGTFIRKNKKTLSSL